jgi:cytochrome c biogenesis protein
VPPFFIAQPDIMRTNTEGIRIHTRRRWLADGIELVSSMRFAISLLSLIAIASVVGTVLKQNEPMPNYVNQFGPFWFELFNRLGLYSVYSTWWFLSIMLFLVLSTALCISRNAPKMIKDMRSWRENVREQSLRNFHHKVEWTAPPGVTFMHLVQQSADRVAAHGYRIKVVDKQRAAGSTDARADGDANQGAPVRAAGENSRATLIAARQGGANKWGYIFAHGAIVVICIGALFDSDLPIRFQQWFGGKTPFAGNGVIAEIAPRHRLGLGNPTFRGNTLIPEGGSSSTAIIQQQAGVLIQDLPVTITLKRFIIDYYSTGMPKLFASEVLVTDHETGRAFPATIKVNEPLLYKGLAIYQSSFDDGGSKLKLVAHPMTGASDKTFEMAGVVGSSTPLPAAGRNDRTGGDRVGRAEGAGGENDGAAAGDGLATTTGNRAGDGAAYTVEWTGFRPLNIENMVQAGEDLRAVTSRKSLEQKLADGLDKRFGSAGHGSKTKDLRNVGPSVQYKLRDRTGQAREYSNYMSPVQADGAYVFLTGMRESPEQPFRYVRIPADDNDSVEEWMRLRAAILDPAKRALAAARFAARALPASTGGDAPASPMAAQLRDSAVKGMAIFAGDDTVSGYVAISRFLEKLPAAEQEKAADIFMKILNGSLWDLWQIAREQDGLAPVAADEKNARFLQLATNAYADSFFYGAPVYLQLSGFEEIKASVFQVTRSPGKYVVYFGCFLLVLGVFSMLYVRERRLWIWIAEDQSGRPRAIMAMSSQRKTMDFEREFDLLGQRLVQTEAGPGAPAPAGSDEWRT